MDANKMLQRMRVFAAAARAGDDVRRNERELRWAFEAFDEALLTAQGSIPDEWRSGCPWAPGGEVYDGSACPKHHRVHGDSQ